MNAQDIFDKAVGSVIRQGDLSVAGQGRCYYRHPDKPLACGVGHLLDDETAARLDDVQSQGSTSEIHKVSVKLVPAELRPHMELLKSIQICHDTAGCDHSDPAPRLLSFVNRMKFTAERFGLEMKFSAEDVAKAVAA